jgi:Rrf2 family protein
MISLKAQYGLRAMVALTAKYNKGTMQAKEIAKSQDVPVRYLELLLSQLRRARLVEATRGKKGGYQLSKRPSSITVLDVIWAFEGSVLFMNTGKSGKDPFVSVWENGEKTIQKYFKSIKLTDLVGKLPKRK